MNFRSVLYIIGLLISTLGCMMFIPAIFDLVNNNAEWGIFASTGIISFLMGITIILAFRNKNTLLIIKLVALTVENGMKILGVKLPTKM